MNKWIFWRVRVDFACTHEFLKSFYWILMNATHLHVEITNLTIAQLFQTERRTFGQFYSRLGDRTSFRTFVFWSKFEAPIRVRKFRPKHFFVRNWSDRSTTLCENVDKIWRRKSGNPKVDDRSSFGSRLGSEGRGKMSTSNGWSRPSIYVILNWCIERRNWPIDTITIQFGACKLSTKARSD